MGRITLTVAVALLAGLAGCAGGGTTPAPRGSSTPTPAPTAATPTPTGTPTADPATDTATPTDARPAATATPSAEALGLEAEITEIADCGRTCREVTYAVTNPTDAAVTDLRADITVRSGGETVWTGNRTVGDVEPGETARPTERVELSLDAALTVSDNDGRVTIVVEFTATEGTQTVSFERQF